MKQEILAMIVILGAAVYLARFIYRAYFSSRGKCDGCAIQKMHRQRMEALRQKSS